LVGDLCPPIVLALKDGFKEFATKTVPAVYIPLLKKMSGLPQVALAWERNPGKSTMLFNLMPRIFFKVLDTK
jgi:hypothetical protein